MSENNPETSMITLQEANVKKRSNIDFNKMEFTSQEKQVIKKEVELIRQKYPGYIPIVVRPKNKKMEISKKKFLVTGEITMGQFLFIIRKKMPNIKASDGIYLFIDGSLPPVSAPLSLIYNEKKDKDTDMLFVTACNENTFG